MNISKTIGSVQTLLLLGTISCWTNVVIAQEEVTPKDSTVITGELDYALYFCADNPESRRHTITLRGESCRKGRAKRIATDRLNDYISRACTTDGCDDVCRPPYRLDGACNRASADAEYWSMRSREKKCGVWPFRKRSWIYEVRATVDCGCRCRSRVSPY